MLTREQIQTLIAIRNRPGSVMNPQGTAYRLPIDVIQKIANVGLDPDPTSEIATLLHHIAYGDLASAKAMLDINPALIGKASHVVTPSGLVVRYVKPYECALGGGDPEMAEMIAGYFDQFTDGVEEKAAQDAKYRQHIEEMLNAEKYPPYDFTLLIETLMAATSEDVTAELNLDFNRESALSNLLAEFRKYFTPGTITSGMHFNYLHLMRALEVYNQYYHELEKYVVYDNYSKLTLFSRQVIGFIQRNLPAIDRMVFAQGLHSYLVTKGAIKRSFKWKYDVGNFPVTSGNTVCYGLGYTCWASEGVEPGAGWCGGGLAYGPRLKQWVDFDEYISRNKQLNLIGIIYHREIEKRLSM